MRVLLLLLIYFVLCPLAGYYLGYFMIYQLALSGGHPNLITMYIVHIVAMILSYVIVGALLKSLFVPRRE